MNGYGEVVVEGDVIKLIAHGETQGDRNNPHRDDAAKCAPVVDPHFPGGINGGDFVGFAKLAPEVLLVTGVAGGAYVRKIFCRTERLFGVNIVLQGIRGLALKGFDSRPTDAAG